MTIGRSDQRREARFPARILAKVVRRGQPIELLTNDVSFRGVFIRTDTPPTLRQLVKFELVLPSGIVVSGHAMVVHVAANAAARAKGLLPVPGIGLQFWGAIANAKEWEQFIHELRVKHRAGLAAAKATDRVRRASERFKLAVEVVLDGKTSMTRDISETGMAIRTELKLPVGTRASVGIRAGEETVAFDVVVRRTIDDPGFRGLGVEFADVDADKRQTLMAFLMMHAPPESVELVPVGDPKLH